MLYHIKLNNIHGIDVYTCIITENGKLIDTSTHMSHEYAVTWAYKTHRKIINKRKKEKLCK